MSTSNRFPRWDLLAALTACAILVPEGVAYAGIAGVPPQVAFYSAPIALAVYALTGSSPRLVVGATAAASVFSAATIGGISHDPAVVLQLTAALSVLAGCLLVATGLARFGFIADFLEPSALTGFLFGMALVIDARQAPKVVGVAGVDGDFFYRLWRWLGALPHWSVVSTVTGVCAFLALVALERRLPRVPGVLVVLVVGIAASDGLDLARHGVAVVGPIPAAVPAWRPPEAAWHDWARLLGGACGMALIVFAVSFGLAQRLAADADPAETARRPVPSSRRPRIAVRPRITDRPQIADRPRIADRLRAQHLDPSREMVALGLANLGTGLVGGFAVTGSASASLPAAKAGGRTRWVSAAGALLTLAVGAFATSAFRDLPEPVLAGIVVAAVRELLTVRGLRRLWSRSRRGVAVALTAVFGVLFFTLLPGLLLAVTLSLGLYIAEASRLRVSVLGALPGTDDFVALDRFPQARPTDGVVVLRPDGTVFYGNIRRLRAAVAARLAEQAEPVSTVVLDLSATFHLAAPVLDGLKALRSDLERAGMHLSFAHLYRDSADAIATSDLADVPRYLSLRDAVTESAH